MRMIFCCLVLATLPFVAEATGVLQLPAVVPCVLPIAIELGAAVMVGWRAWTLPGRGAERTGWTLLAAALACWALADLVLYLLFGTGEGTSPDAADPIYFVFYALFAAAIGSLVRARMSGHRRVSILGEGLVAALGVATIATAALFGPVLDALGGGVASTLVTLAYPVCDVAVLCLACLGCSLTGWRPGRPIVLCCLGALAFTVGDSSWALDVTLADGHLAAWSSVLWSLSALLLADAAWRPLQTLAGRPNHAAPLFVGFAFALVACTIMAVDRWISIPAVSTLCAVATIAVGLARTARLIAHSVRRIEHFRAESLTDGLTGLGNRRRLMADLEQVVADSAGGGATLAMFDLDGFKDYNDTFGHAAGDALLVRLANSLTAAAAGDARPYRLGGDEFCVLLDGRRDEHDPHVQRVADGFRISGEGFAIDASCGLAVIPDEADSAAEALRIADGRMYVRKESARPSNVRSARDVLVRALREREPELGAHIRGVADLSTAVGQRLGLSTEALEVLGRAAELHDVGKLAMPDRLLGKPTGLDEGEWALMRCHPEIGARILAPVAALAPVAELVLASHERWDGSGYPAGLAGEAIPLGARIIAVCDVYDAMVTDLPYAPARQAPEALAEITAAAGTQFDPAVVAAFAAELSVAL